MGFNREIVQAGQQVTLLASTVITTAATVTGTALTGLAGLKVATVEAVFAYGSGGINATAYVQTTLDEGATWIDIASFQFLTATASKASKVSVYAALAAAVTPGDGVLAANTVLDGLLGDQLRVKVISTGTYATNTTIALNAVLKA